ncbi:MAG: hypothetical protein PHO37_19140, partial [Kiritimatiellae bacterium]|nr:hypothetical protein [Kiritimatiellia bacterium]
MPRKAKGQNGKEFTSFLPAISQQAQKRIRMQNHRGHARKPSSKPISTHYGTGPNEVWMWDITWLPGPAKGIYFYLYLILDLFSRKVVAWEI